MLGSESEVFELCAKRRGQPKWLKVVLNFLSFVVVKPGETHHNLYRIKQSHFMLATLFSVI